MTGKFMIPLTLTSSGIALTGYSGHVYIVPAGNSVNSDLPLTEDANTPGLYYRASVTHGSYDVYVDSDKDGTPVAGDLKIEDYDHGVIDATVTTDKIVDAAVDGDKIANDSVSINQFTQAARDYVGSGGSVTNNPDDVYLATNASSQITLKEKYQKRWDGDSAASTGLEIEGVWSYLEKNNIINPLTYGCAGDGLTDDTTNFSAAVAAVTDGLVFDLAGGTYLIEGMDFANRKNVIVKNGTIKFKTSSINKYIFQMYSLQNVVFENIVFDGNSDGQYWLYTYSNEQVNFKNCTFKDLGDGSVSVWGVRVRDSNKIVFEGCIFDTILSSGISRALFFTDTAATPGKYSKVVNCHFESILPSTDSDAIYAEASGTDKNIKLTITGNTFVNCAKRYVKLNADGITVRNNKGYAESLSTDMFACVSAYGDDIIVDNNQFFFSGTLATYYLVEMTTDHNGIKITNNVARCGSVLSSSYAVYLAGNLTNVLISGNTIENFDYGVKDSNSASPDSKSIKIIGNEFIGLTDHVIHFTGDTYDLYVSGNRCPTAISNRYFLYLSGTNENPICEDNKHNCSYGLTNIRLAEAKGNFNGTAADYEYNQGVKIDYRTAAPSSGAWEVGDKVYNSSPAASGFFGWVCITAGSPGTWKGFGTIES